MIREADIDDRPSDGVLHSLRVLPCKCEGDPAAVIVIGEGLMLNGLLSLVLERWCLLSVESAG